MNLTTAVVVKTLRTLHGQSQAQLQAQTGLHRSVIIDIEKNRRIIQADERSALERAFGVSLELAGAHLSSLLPQSK